MFITLLSINAAAAVLMIALAVMATIRRLQAGVKREVILDVVMCMLNHCLEWDK